MANQRRAGTIQVQTNGEIQDAAGSFSYNLGGKKRETIVGPDGVHGFKEMPQPAFIEGELVDRGNLNLRALVDSVDVTVTLSLANGKVVVLRDGWFAGEGTASTDEAKIPVRWEGTNAEEIS
jgi:hypothetical protein